MCHAETLEIQKLQYTKSVILHEIPEYNQV